MKVQFDGSEGEIITRQDAKMGIANYRASGSYVANNGIKGFLFGKDHISSLLSQNGCMGIRVYYGYNREVNNSLSPQLILVGTDELGNDIVSNDKIIDYGYPCPRICPPDTSIED